MDFGKPIIDNRERGPLIASRYDRIF